jgi:PleD family two-component response regulator
MLTTEAATHKVVIVNGNAEMMGVVENVLESGHYDVVFVQSNAHAYSQVRQVRPNLVILCLDMNNPEGFQVLSMLRLDEATRDIPVLTYSDTFDPQQSDEEVAEPSEPEMFSAVMPARMN